VIAKKGLNGIFYYEQVFLSFLKLGTFQVMMRRLHIQNLLLSSYHAHQFESVVTTEKVECTIGMNARLEQIYCEREGNYLIRKCAKTCASSSITFTYILVATPRA
jgi:hypothetical protein